MLAIKNCAIMFIHLKWIIYWYYFCNLGFGLGAAIGLFSSSVNPNVAAVEKQQTVREIFRDMKTTTVGYAKNFAVVGGVFSAVECAIESASIFLK